MSRLDIERQHKIQPKRMEYAIEQLKKCGIENIIVIDGNEIEFQYKNKAVKFFPYSGWHTGKSIKDGRGIDLLLKQLKP